MLWDWILIVPSWIFLFLKNWRDLDFYEQKFQEIEKFHVRKVKCLVRSTERKMSVWWMEASDDRFQQNIQHFWNGVRVAAVANPPSLALMASWICSRKSRVQGHFPFSRIPVWNFTCPVEQYIPVENTWPNWATTHLVILFLQAGYKRAALGRAIFSNGKGHFGPTYWNG